MPTSVVANPVRAAAGGIAVGMLLGFVLPQTAAERARLAPLAGRLLRRAKAAARRIFEDAITGGLGRS